MVVRIVTRAAESREAAEDWVREHADSVRDVPGIERIICMSDMVPPQVGAVMAFDPDDAPAPGQAIALFDRLGDSLRLPPDDGDEIGPHEECWVMSV